MPGERPGGGAMPIGGAGRLPCEEGGGRGTPSAAEAPPGSELGGGGVPGTPGTTGTGVTPGGAPRPTCVVLPSRALRSIFVFLVVSAIGSSAARQGSGP